ncbi:MAG: FG-GAP repeat domain-containing protein [Pirellulales bacterium]
MLFGLGDRKFVHQRGGTFPEGSFDPSALLGWDHGSVAEKSPASGDDIRFFPRVVVSGYFNDDAYLDLGAVDDRANEVSVFLGYGNGTYQPALRLPTLDDPEWLATGHLNDDNGDGRFDDGDYPDLVIAHDNGAAVSIMLGTGNGMFQEGETYSLPGGSEKVLIADVNGDGTPDLACNANKNLVVLAGKGNGTFELPQVKARGTASSAMSTGDFDGDGRLEVASMYVDDSSLQTLAILMNPEDEGTVNMEPLQLPKGAEVQSLTAADLDGDGNLDLVAADLTWHRLFIFWGLGDGTFELEELELAQRRISSPWDASTRSVVVEDFNGDGHMDLATVNEFDGQVSVVLGNGDRTFQSERTFDTGTGPGTLVAGDVDSDGHLDLIVGNRGSFDVSILMGGRGGTDWGFDPERTMTITAGQEPLPAVTADVNGDGRLDKVIADDNTNSLSVLLNLGDESLDSRRISAEISSTPIMADLDGDGMVDSVQVDLQGRILVRFARPSEPGTFLPPQLVNPGTPVRDIAVVSTGAGTLLAAVGQDMSRQGGTIVLYSVDETRHFVAREAAVRAGSFPTKIAAADLNRDGRDDLVVIDGAKESVSVFFATADGSFAWQSTAIVGNVPSTLALIDVGSNVGGPDHWVDIVVANEVSGDVSILLNDGTGNFSSAALRLRASTGAYGVRESVDADSVAVYSSAETNGIASGDLNEDGVLDLVLTNTGLNTFSVLYGKPHGGFADPVSVNTGSGPTEVRVADFNHDGHLDVVVLNERAATLSTFLGDGTGGLRELRPAVEAGDSPSGLTVRDANADGNLDLLVGNKLADLLVLLGNGDGTFEPPPLVRGQHVALAAADVNKDGHDELILANESLDRVSVQLNQGGELWEGKADPLLAPGAVEVVDLNGDDYLDIVVANSGANNVLVYLGLGGGRFAEARSFAVGTKPVSLTIGDLNDDRLPDILVANEGSNDISILLGDPRSLLRQGVRLSAGTAPVATEIGNFYGDASIDILVASSGDNKVYLLPGLGGGFFDDKPENRIEFLTGNAPRKLAVAQFDGDQTLDLVTLNSGSNDVTFYPNFAALAAGTNRVDRTHSTTVSTGGTRPVDFVVCDTNADAKPDLLIAHNGGSFSLLSSNGSGFAQPQRLTLWGDGSGSARLTPASSLPADYRSSAWSASTPSDKTSAHVISELFTDIAYLPSDSSEGTLALAASYEGSNTPIRFDWVYEGDDTPFAPFSSVPFVKLGDTADPRVDSRSPGDAVVTTPEGRSEDVTKTNHTTVLPEDVYDVGGRMSHAMEQAIKDSLTLAEPEGEGEGTVSAIEESLTLEEPKDEGDGTLVAIAGEEAQHGPGVELATHDTGEEKGPGSPAGGESMPGTGEENPSGGMVESGESEGTSKDRTSSDGDHSDGAIANHQDTNSGVKQQTAGPARNATAELAIDNVMAQIEAGMAFPVYEESAEKSSSQIWYAAGAAASAAAAGGARWLYRSMHSKRDKPLVGARLPFHRRLNTSYRPNE